MGVDGKQQLKFFKAKKKIPGRLYFGCSKYGYFKWFDGNVAKEVSSRRQEDPTQVQISKSIGNNVVSPTQILIMINMSLLIIFIFIQIVKSI